MASSSGFLSEKQLQCSICLDVFTEPVTTPCGHNFCKACITKYWNANELRQCPLCKKRFFRRLELNVNVFISEIAAQYRKSSAQVKSDKQDQQAALAGEVPCDFCTGPKLKALKSCLVCQMSYCKTHLENHQRTNALRHKLIDPVKDLEDRMCKRHDKPLVLFCRSDQTCVCQICEETDHMTHETVPLEEECGQRKVMLKQIKTQVQLMIQERLKKVQKTKQSVDLKQKNAEKDIAESIEVFTALAASIGRSQADLIEVIEEKQKVAEKQAEGFIKGLEQEIAELQRRSTELEKLSHTEDHLHLLQSFTALSSPPATKDWTEVSVRSDVSVGTVRRAVAQLEETLSKEMEKLLDAELKLVQQYAVDVTLDPESAHPILVLSEDGKQVSDGDKRKKCPDNPERFDLVPSVLGKDGFNSGRFYYEVQVKDKPYWSLGVARESINRKGEITLSPRNGHWTIWLWNGDAYEALAGPDVSLSLKQKPQKVGVFVDYEEGQVSFYDVEARAHIYSYTRCVFTEKLYPYFGPYLNIGAKRSAPLIITPVKHTG